MSEVARAFDYLAEKYGITFPEIPNLFNACDDPTAAIVDLPSSPAVTFLPEAPLIQATPATIARALPSTTAMAPLSLNAKLGKSENVTNSSLGMNRMDI